MHRRELIEPLLFKQTSSRAAGSPSPSPVLQLLAADAHGPLVTLGNAHLVMAALHLLAGVLGGVQGCRDIRSGCRSSGNQCHRAQESPVPLLSWEAPLLSDP